MKTESEAKRKKRKYNDFKCIKSRSTNNRHDDQVQNQDDDITRPPFREQVHFVD